MIFALPIFYIQSKKNDYSKHFFALNNYSTDPKSHINFIVSLCDKVIIFTLPIFYF